MGKQQRFLRPTVLITTVILLSLLLGGIGLWQVTVQQQVGESWKRIQEESQKKLILLESIQDKLGFGGLIHDFKNYLLRNEERYFISFQERLLELRSVLDEYSAIASTEQEFLALQDLRNTFEQYQQNFERILELRTDGLAVTSIDSAVKIDDRPAIMALEILEQEWLANQSEATRNIETAFSINKRLVWISVALLPLFLVGVLMLPFMYRSMTREARKRIRNEKRLEAMAGKLARAERVAQIGHWSVNTRMNTVFWSPEVYRIHGVSDESFRPTLETAIQFFHPDDRPHVQRCVQDALQLGRTFEFEARIITQAGDIRYMKAQGHCEMDERGSITGLFGVARDITDQKLQELELRKSESKLRAIIENSHDAVFILDSNGLVQQWNQAVKEVFGYQANDMLGQHIQNFVQLVPPSHSSDHAASEFLSASDARENYSSLPAEGVRKNGDVFPIDCKVSLVKHADEILTLLFIRDDTQRQQTAEQLLALATTDGLTGALNRRYFIYQAELEIQRAHRYGSPLSVIAADLDYFKNINDTYGHAAGDLTLQQFVRTAKSLLRNNDLLGRSGGEEFLILLPQTDQDQARIVAERLTRGVALVQIPYENEVISCTVSLGVASLHHEANETYDQLMKRVDDALYQAKKTGRNRSVYLPAV